MAPVASITAKINADNRQFARATLEMQKDLRRLRKEASMFNRSMAKSGGYVKRFAASFVGVYAVRSLIAGVTREAGQFNLVMAKISKTTRITGHELNMMGEKISKMAIHIGTSRKEMGLLARAIGRLNVSGTENILEFTEVVAKFSEATNFNMEQAGTQLARFLNLTGNSSTAVRRVASSIVHLGNNFAATETEITGMALALSQSTAAFKISDRLLTSLGATLAAAGARQESAATAYNKLFIMFEKHARVGGDGLKILADIIRDTTAATKEFIETDIEGFLVKFLGALGSLKQGSQIDALAALGLPDVRSVKTILPIVRQEYESKELSRALGLVDTQTDKGEALDKEFKRRSRELSEHIKRLGERFSQAFQEMSTALGNFLPVFQALYKPIKSFMEVLTDIGEQFKENNLLAEYFLEERTQQIADAMGTDPRLELAKGQLGIKQQEIHQAKLDGDYDRKIMIEIIDESGMHAGWEESGMTIGEKLEKELERIKETIKKYEELAEEKQEIDAQLLRAEVIVGDIINQNPYKSSTFNYIDPKILKQQRHNELLRERARIMLNTSNQEERASLISLANQKSKVSLLDEEIARFKRNNDMDDAANKRKLEAMTSRKVLDDAILKIMMDQHGVLMDQIADQERINQLLEEQQEIRARQSHRYAGDAGTAGAHGVGFSQTAVDEYNKKMAAIDKLLMTEDGDSTFFGHPVSPGDRRDNLRRNETIASKQDQLRGMGYKGPMPTALTDDTIKQLDRLIAKWRETQQQIAQYNKRIGDTLEESVAGPLRALVHGGSLTDALANSFGNLKNQIIEMAVVEPILKRVRASIDSLMSPNKAGIGGGLFGGLFGGGGGGGGGLGSIIGSIAGSFLGFPMPFAEGGTPKRNMRALVGERGPEVIDLPKGATVYPTGKMPAMGGITINLGGVHVDGVNDRSTIRDEVNNLMPTIERTIKGAVAQDMVNPTSQLGRASRVGA